MGRILEGVLIALRAIWGSKLRSFMSVLGNIVAVTSIIAVVFLIQGLNASVTDAIVSEVGADSFVVDRYGVTRSEEDFEKVRSNPRISLRDAAAIRKFSPLVRSVMAESSRSGQVAFREKLLESVSVRGVSAEYVNFSSYNAERGRLLSPSEVERNRNVVLLGWGTADRLFGQATALDKVIKIEGIRFRVIGVNEKKGAIFGQSQDEFAVVPLGAFQKLLGARASNTLNVKPASPDVVEAAMQDATVALRIERRLKPKQKDNFGMFTSDSILAIYHDATSKLFAVLVGVVALSLVVGGIVIMNIMLMVVTERTFEIGLRKALGAKRRDIMLQVLAESVTLSVAGGIVGTSLGFLLAWIIASVSPLPAAVQLWSVALGIGITAVVGVVFGVYPAMRAAKLDPIEALRRDWTMAVRLALFTDIIGMAAATPRANKLRAALTILGVVIGITAIVGMTSLIRGFDESIKDSIRELGPNTLFVAKFSGLSFASGKEFKDLIKRPVLTVADAKAIEREAPSAGKVDVWLGAWGMPGRERAYYKGEKTKELSVIGVSENYAAVNFLKLANGRFFTESEVQHRRAVAVLGDSPTQALFPDVDPVGKTIRVGAVAYEVVGTVGKRTSPFGDNGGQDDFLVVPYTTFQKQFGWQRSGRINVNGTMTDASAMQSAMIAVVPKEDATHAAVMAEVEQILRIRHGLKLDQANDFDIITQDAALKMYDQITGAVFIGLVVISSIALMVGGIGVMAIMMISVTERTREIGVRKALGARRREILWQFLLEAVFLTSVGGVLGIVLGASIGLGVHYATGFPISMPWWSFALGFGFSGSVGIFFGLVPAIRAARLDPIEALRYE